MKDTRKKRNPSPGILDWINDAWNRYLKAYREGVEAERRRWVNLGVGEPKTEDGREVVGAIIGPAITFTGQGKPVTPESAKDHAFSEADEINKSHTAVAVAMVAAELGSLGQLDYTLTEFMDLPSMQAHRNIARGAWESEFKYGYEPLLKRYWLSTYKPFVPPIQDLRLMAVREAFPVAPGPPQYREMEKWALEQGMDPFWTERYLYMGFERMDVRDAVKYFMYWRHDPEGYKAFLRIADIHPDDRDRVAEVAFRPPGVREIGYGYDVGAYDMEDIEVFRRKAGQSPEDAKKSAVAMVKYRLSAEEEALRREALADFVAGLDTEAELRAKLASFRSRPEVIELWTARAKYRAERDLTMDLVKVVTTDFVKGWSSENEFRQDLIELGVVPERRDVIMAQAKARRAKYKRADTAEKKRTITLARVRKARDLGLIGDEEYVRRLEDHNYTPDDARLDLQIELTPKPITPEEIERRQRTVTSKLNRARRRYERSIKRIQDQIELTALQLEDTTIMKDEALDVIDAQISVYDELIAIATPERVPVLEERKTVLIQRRELTEARWTTRIRKLTEQQTDLKETKALIEKQRDEEVGEYEDELKLIGGVAG